MPNRVVIDLDKLRMNPDCHPECSYPYQKDAYYEGTLPSTGPTWLKHKAGFEVFCRRCDDHPCVNACPFEALEQMDDGLIKRYNMRCVECHSCEVACPFGTIVPTALVLRDAVCDLCVGRDDPAPQCCQSCDSGAFVWEDVPDELPEDSDVHIINDRMAVRTKAFVKVETVPGELTE